MRCLLSKKVIKRGMLFLFIALDSIIAFTQINTEIKEEKIESFTVIDEFQVFNIEGKYGIKNSSGKVLLNPEFDNIRFSSNRHYSKNDLDEFALLTSKNLCGIFSIHSNKIIIPINYKTVELLATHYTTNTVFEQVFGLRNLDHTISLVKYSSIESSTHIVKSKIKDVTKINDSICGIKENKYWKFYNLKTQKYHSSQVFDSFEIINQRNYTPKNKPILVNLKKKYGIFNQNLENIVPITFDSILFKTPFVLAYRNGKIKLYDENFEKNMDIDDYSIDYDFIKVSINNKFGILNKKLQIQMPIVYTELDIKRISFSDLLIFCTQNSQLKIFKIGHENDSLFLDNLTFFKYLNLGFAVKKENKIALFDNQLKQIMDYQAFDNIYLMYYKGYYKSFYAKKDSMLYFVADNKILDSISADSVQMINQNIFAAFKNNKYAIISYDNINDKAEYIYDYIELNPNKPSFILSRINNEYVYINEKGEEQTERFLLNTYHFKSLNEIGDALIQALVSHDDSLMYLFAKNILPDFEAFEYIKTHYFDHRSFVKGFSIESYEYSISKYVEQLLFIKKRIQNNNSIHSIQLIEIPSSEKINDPQFRNNDIYGVALPFKLIIDEKEYKIKLGELLLINNKYYSFTLPKFISE
jgi:hypothetical protein